ncbi:uncharacterized protein [Nicotiana sylvestris]|uniref:uncharacterized protein n=1 Tax=Nicotiana sylvestris TaxID=4096 RepID=UPI00388CDCCF
MEVRIDVHDEEVETQDDVNPSREYVIDMPKMVVPKAKAPLPRPPPPYPQRLTKQMNENQFRKFIDMMKSLSINIPLVEALEQMPGYANFMKDLVIKKRSMDCETIKMTHQVSEIVHSMAPNLEDPVTFTIPCTIGSANFAKTLCDLGANINLIPYSMFKTLGIGQPRATSMRLQMADRTMKRPLGIVDDILVRVDKFILPTNFVILDLIVDDTSAMINVEDPLEAVFLNLDENEDESRVECVNALHEMGSYYYEPRNLSLDLENRKTPPTKPSIEEPPVDATLTVLQKWKKAIGWTLADIWGISPAFCMQNIILDEDAKPSVEHQRRLNEAMQEVVKKEVIKWLDARVVYPISDSSWTSSLQYVTKKGDMTVVTNAQNELIPTRTVTVWRVLARCEETNFVLNWEKCYFMVKEGIVLSHKISKQGIEVAKVKIEVISKLPPPTSVKGVRGSLGHAGFY